MKPYLHYTIEDLASDEDFLKWVKYPDRYPHLQSFWKQWLVEHPEKQELVDEARCLVLAVLAEDQFFPGRIKQKALWHRIEASTGIRSGNVLRLRQHWYRFAAVFLMFLGVGWWVFERNESAPVEEQLARADMHFIKHVNNADSPQTIVLGDGSSIVLERRSVLEYPRTFAADAREVRLTGEAFFNVTRDPERPFLVRSGDVITRVLGTSFTVRNMEREDRVLIQVKTGKVSVFLANERFKPSPISDNNVEGVVLMPNQQVLYERNGMKMTKSLVENPSVLALPDRKSFEFADEPIKDVFAAIEEAYGVEVVFDEQALANCYLNASLNEVNLYDKLRLICKAINATYEIMDTHIIVYGKGCGEDIELQTP